MPRGHKEDWVSFPIRIRYQIFKNPWKFLTLVRGVEGEEENQEHGKGTTGKKKREPERVTALKILSPNSSTKKTKLPLNFN